MIYCMELMLNPSSIQCQCHGSDVIERLRAPNSNSGVSDQQSVGSNPPAVTLVSLSKTLNHCFVLRMGHKAIDPMCCVIRHVKGPSALIEKRRGSARCSWLWLLYAPQHLVNPYKVLTNWVSEFITAITYVSESLYILSALSTLFGR